MATPSYFGFFAERQVGVGSAALAIEPHVRAAGHAWTDVTYFKPGGMIEQTRLLPPRVRGTLRGFEQVRAGLAAGPFQALFFVTQNPAVLHAGALSKTPTVLWTDVTPAQLDDQAEQYGHPVATTPLFRSLKHQLVRRTFERAAAVVGWCNWTRSSLSRDYGLPAEQTHVIHPGIDLTRFSVSTGPIPTGLPRLLFVGGDFERKGGALLLSVYREHFRERALLDVVTREKVEESPGVRVHYGLTPDSPALIDLYHGASAFVLPTRGDCFPIASLEAMAMGLPVILGNVGGAGDIVEPGVTGHLVQPGDGQDLRHAIEDLLTSEEVRRSMGSAARRVAEVKFDARGAARQLIELLTRVSKPRCG